MGAEIACEVLIASIVIGGNPDKVLNNFWLTTLGTIWIAFVPRREHIRGVPAKIWMNGRQLADAIRLLRTINQCWAEAASPGLYNACIWVRVNIPNSHQLFRDMSCSDLG